MNIESARSAAYSAVNSAVATLNPVPKVDWDNRFLVDRNNQTAPFLAVDFMLGSGVQKSLGEAKVVRYIGQLAIAAYIKEGAGIATVTTMMDTLAHALGMKTFSGLNTQAAVPQRSLVVDGWHIQPLAVPFWFDDLVVG